MTKMKRRQFTHTLAGLAGIGLTRKLAGAGSAEPSNGNEPPAGSIIDVPGIRVGHFTSPCRPTGCTVILFENDATAGVDHDGSVPGSHQGVQLQLTRPAEKIHGMHLTGGGAFGLAAVSGVVRYLEGRKIGRADEIAGAWFWIVVGASIYDLRVGDSKIRPDPESAYEACQVASSRPVEQGSVGAGAGATVGKMLEGFGGMKGGIGSASLRPGEVVIGALAVVHGMGDIIDWHSGKIIAGARRPDGKGFVNIAETLKKRLGGNRQSSIRIYDSLMQSANLVVVATNADFNKPNITKIATMGMTGAARVINPYHMTSHGDSTFGLSTNRIKSDLPVSVVGALAAEVVSEAILNAIELAKSIEGWSAYCDYAAG